MSREAFIYVVFPSLCSFRHFLFPLLQTGGRSFQISHFLQKRFFLFQTKIKHICIDYAYSHRSPEEELFARSAPLKGFYDAQSSEQSDGKPKRGRKEEKEL